MGKGKLIVFYGINNLGKTTQAKLLVERLSKEGHNAKYLKYGIYDLEPSGPILNGYLRNGNPYKLTAREFQIIQSLNRTQYESKLKEDLEQGTNVVAEDYWGTAWGIGAGVDKNFLLEINKHLLREDLAFLFIGDRFSSGVEKNHRHEGDEELTKRVARFHAELANEFGWIWINASQTIDRVSDDIWAQIKKIL